MRALRAVPSERVHVALFAVVTRHFGLWYLESNVQLYWANFSFHTGLVTLKPNKLHFHHTWWRNKRRKRQHTYGDIARTFSIVLYSYNYFLFVLLSWRGSRSEEDKATRQDEEPARQARKKSTAKRPNGQLYCMSRHAVKSVSEFDTKNRKFRFHCLMKTLCT